MATAARMRRVVRERCGDLSMKVPFRGGSAHGKADGVALGVSRGEWGSSQASFRSGPVGALREPRGGQTTGRELGAGRIYQPGLTSPAEPGGRVQREGRPPS